MHWFPFLWINDSHVALALKRILFIEILDGFWDHVLFLLLEVVV